MYKQLHKKKNSDTRDYIFFITWMDTDLVVFKMNDLFYRRRYLTFTVSVDILPS